MYDKKKSTFALGKFVTPVEFSGPVSSERESRFSLSLARALLCVYNTHVRHAANSSLRHFYCVSWCVKKHTHTDSLRFFIC